MAISGKSNRSFAQVSVNCLCGRVVGIPLGIENVINRECRCGIKFQVTLPNAIVRTRRAAVSIALSKLQESVDGSKKR